MSIKTQLDLAAKMNNPLFNVSLGTASSLSLDGVMVTIKNVDASNPRAQKIMFGHLVHEVPGHGALTDLEVFRRSMIVSMLNVVEDIRIEAVLERTKLGARHFLQEMNEELFYGLPTEAFMLVRAGDALHNYVLYVGLVDVLRYELSDALGVCTESLQRFISSEGIAQIRQLMAKAYLIPDTQTAELVARRILDIAEEHRLPNNSGSKPTDEPSTLGDPSPGSDPAPSQDPSQGQSGGSGSGSTGLEGDKKYDSFSFVQSPVNRDRLVADALASAILDASEPETGNGGTHCHFPEMAHSVDWSEVRADLTGYSTDLWLKTYNESAQHALVRRILQPVLLSHARKGRRNSEYGDQICQDRLVDLIAGKSTDVFLRETVKKVQDTSVELLLDLSTSMQNGPRSRAWHQSLAAAYVVDALRPASGVRVAVSAVCHSSFMLIKDYTDRMVLLDFAKTSYAAMGRTPLEGAIMKAVGRLMSQKQSGKVLIIMTDCGLSPERRRRIADLLQSISAASGIKIGIIGINTKYRIDVDAFAQLDDVQQFPTVLAEMTASILK